MHIIVKSLPHADIDPIDEAPTYRLNKAWVCVLKVNGRLKRLEIEKGYTHDGASIPWFGRFLIDRDGVHRESVLLHDYLYENEGRIELGDDDFFYTRKDADQVMRECLKAQGLSSWKVFLMYNAVRGFGWMVRTF
jgi:hypothetical protein